MTSVTGTRSWYTKYSATVRIRHKPTVSLCAKILILAQVMVNIHTASTSLKRDVGKPLSTFYAEDMFYFIHWKKLSGQAARGPFLESSETFRAFFGCHNSNCIVKTEKFF